MISTSEIPKFIIYLQNHYKYVEEEKLNTFVINYLGLNHHTSNEDCIKKETIDNVFQTLYGISLQNLIDKFSKDKELIIIESEETKLRRRVGELEEVVAELRDSYWNVKQQLNARS